MSEQTMVVRFVGGPDDWRGRVMEVPVSDPSDPGTMLISDHVPWRPDDEDLDPRAVYTPDPPPADQRVWIFRGWFPSSRYDPPVDSYGK
ncbi:hypothetical protein [Marinactinospora rubrisoli]|uniref:Uncharacterized protein n=1 Tax=Marinactinospora rubrisoli TaxID=2715399 RepID=A0ABW2KR08_9ACTN